MTSSKILPEVLLLHWANLFEDFEYSPQDFYTALEEALKKRDIPGAEITRVDFKEGGAFSLVREYKRVIRRRLVFDVCAAKFGTGFFVSYRLGFVPLRFTILHLLALLLTLMSSGSALCCLISNYKVVLGVYLLLIACAPVLVILFALKNVLSLDDSIARIPVLGDLYTMLIDKQAYFQVDTRLMFKEAVESAIMETIDAMTDTTSYRKLTDEERQPLFENLFAVNKKGKTYPGYQGGG